MNLYVVLELSSLFSVILIAYEGRSSAVWAALRYLLLAGLGMTFYLFCLGLVYGREALSISALAQHGGLECGYSDRSRISSRRRGC